MPQLEFFGCPVTRQVMFGNLPLNRDSLPAPVSYCLLKTRMSSPDATAPDASPAPDALATTTPQATEIISSSGSALDSFSCCTCGETYASKPSGRCLACQRGPQPGSLCHACFRAHERGVLAGHAAIKAEHWDARSDVLVAYGAVLQSQICELHGEPVTFWCPDCGGGELNFAPMCTSCVPDHAGHIFCSTTAAAREVHRTFAYLMSEAPLAPAAVGGQLPLPCALDGLTGLVERLLAQKRALVDQAAAARARAVAARDMHLQRLRPGGAAPVLDRDKLLCARAGIERALTTALAQVTAAETAKLAALELDASRASAARDLLGAEIATLRAATEALTSTDIVALASVLTARLRALLDALRPVFASLSATDTTLEILLPEDLPLQHQEDMARESATAAAMASIRPVAPIAAPPRFLVVASAVGAGDVELGIATRGGSVVAPGDPVSFVLRLTAAARARAIAPIPAVLAALAVRAAVTIVALPPGLSIAMLQPAKGRSERAQPVPVLHVLAIDEEAGAIHFRCTVPAAAGGGGRLALVSATVSGEPVSGAPVELETACLSAADVVLSGGFGPGVVASPGATVTASLCLTSAACSASGFSSPAALAFLASRTRATASIAALRSSTSTPVRVDTAVDPAGSAVRLSLVVPTTFLGGATVTVSGVWVDGRPLRGPPFTIDVPSRDALARTVADAAADSSRAPPPVLVHVLLGLPSHAWAGHDRTAARFAALAALAARMRISGECVASESGTAAVVPHRVSGALQPAATTVPAQPEPLLPRVDVDVKRGAVAVSFAIPADVTRRGGAAYVTLGLPDMS